MIEKFESGKWYRYDGTDKIKQYLEEIAQRDKLITDLERSFYILTMPLRDNEW